MCYHKLRYRISAGNFHPCTDKVIVSVDLFRCQLLSRIFEYAPRIFSLSFRSGRFN